MTLIPGHRNERKHKLLLHLFTKFTTDLKRILYNKTCWCDDAHTHFILSIEYSKERTPLIDMVKKRKMCVLICIKFSMLPQERERERERKRERERERERE